MKKFKFEKKLKEAVLKGRINGQALVVVDGKELTAQCSAWGKISYTEGVPCLVSENNNRGIGRYIVEAVSFGNQGEGRKWLCIRPMLFEQAVEYFLGNHQLENMLVDYDYINTMPAATAGISRPDFETGNAWIEVRVLKWHSNTISDCNCWFPYSAIRQTEKYYKRLTATQETGIRRILLLVNQYGEEGEKQIISNKKPNKILDRVIQNGVEIWVANLQFDAEGISLQDYQNIGNRILNI